MSERPEEESESPADADDEKWPVGFLLIVFVTAIYLLFRLIQGIIWVIQHL